MAGTFTVQRTIDISALPIDVYPHLVDFRRWQAWSPWEDIDPSLVRTYSGAESGVGAVYEWQGNRKVGQGRMEIVDCADNSSVDIALDFLKPFKASNRAEFRIERGAPSGSADSATTVTWTMTGATNVLTRVLGIIWPMDKMVGKDFEKGLGRLKSVAEAA